MSNIFKKLNKYVKFKLKIFLNKIVKNSRYYIGYVLLFQNIFLCKFIPHAIIFYSKESIIFLPKIS